MVVKTFFGLILGGIVGSISTMVLTVLRFGIPMCNVLIKNEEEVEAVKLLRTKYLISLIIWVPIISGITFLCYKFLFKEGFYGYLVSWVFTLLVGFGTTGKNENNFKEFQNSLDNNKEIIDNKK